MPDPRVFLAAERTLLAWIRSGLTVMGLGFVVAKFGFFLTLMSGATAASFQARQPHWLSMAIGVGLLLLGASVIVGALQNHRLYVRTLPAEDVPKLAMPWLTSFLASSVALVGLLLALYLVVT